MSKAPPKPKRQTPIGHLNSIENRCAFCVRYKDAKRLDDYLRSDMFAESFGALSGADMRIRAIRAITRALDICGSRLPPVPRVGEAAPFSLKDPANVQRLMASWKRHGTDIGLARDLQIPLPAARTARWKVIGRIGRPRPQKAEIGADAR
jgi:hypothetical protein